MNEKRATYLEKFIPTGVVDTDDVVRSLRATSPKVAWEEVFSQAEAQTLERLKTKTQPLPYESVIEALKVESGKTKYVFLFALVSALCSFVAALALSPGFFQALSIVAASMGGICAAGTLMFASDNYVFSNVKDFKKQRLERQQATTDAIVPEGIVFKTQLIPSVQYTGGEVVITRSYPHTNRHGEQFRSSKEALRVPVDSSNVQEVTQSFEDIVKTVRAVQDAENVRYHELLLQYGLDGDSLEATNANLRMQLELIREQTMLDEGVFDSLNEFAIEHGRIADLQATASA